MGNNADQSETSYYDDDARKVLEKARDRKLAAFDAEEQEA